MEQRLLRIVPKVGPHGLEAIPLTSQSPDIHLWFFGWPLNHHGSISKDRWIGLSPKFLLVLPCTAGIINYIHGPLVFLIPPSGCHDSNASHSPVSRFIHDPWSLQHKQPIPGPHLRASAKKASGPWPVQPGVSVEDLKVGCMDMHTAWLHDAHMQWEVNQIKIELGPFPYMNSIPVAYMHACIQYLN